MIRAIKLGLDQKGTFERLRVASVSCAWRNQDAGPSIEYQLRG